MRELLPVSMEIAGSFVRSETRAVAVGAHVLVLSTTIASPAAPYSLHSTYVGQRGEATAATHLLLAPSHNEARLTQHRHEPHARPVAEDERQLCLYDHLQQLVAALTADGLDLKVDVDDRSVTVVNR